MAAQTNSTTSAQMVKGLNIDLIQRFDNENSNFQNLLGVFDVETMAAGTQINQLKVTGSLSTATVTEGEETPLSQYQTEYVPVGAIKVNPYRKLTTAQAILQSGFVKAINKTDIRMVNQVRKARMQEFFTYLANGTTTATGASLQAALAQADAKLNDKLEECGEAASKIIHFVNRFDIADYLAEATVTTQTIYGMDYLESFLGVTDIFVTSMVPQGTIYATPSENIHIYAADFAALSIAGLAYDVSDSGLIGVCHEPNYARTSCETHILSGVVYFAEVTDFIVKATINAPSGTSVAAASLSTAGAGAGAPVSAPAGASQTPAAYDPEAGIAPTMDNTKDEIVAYAAANEISLDGCTNKTQMLEVIAGAGAAGAE